MTRLPRFAGGEKHVALKAARRRREKAMRGKG